MAKAIGETISITLVNDASKNLVKINPTMNIDKITPDVTSTPSKIIVFLVVEVVETLLAKYDKNPGYRGRTQTAPRGANNPARKDIHRLSSALTI